MTFAYFFTSTSGIVMMVLGDIYGDPTYWVGFLVWAIGFGLQVTRTDLHD